MSITWEEPGSGEWIEVEPRRPAAWKRVVGQVAALAVLAVIGVAGGAAIAAWNLGDRAQAAAVEASAEPEAVQPPAGGAAISGPREIAAAPTVREAVGSGPSAPPAGSGAETVTSPTERVSLFPEGETAAVADTGPGMATEQVAGPSEPAPADAARDTAPPNGIDVAETASILSPGEPVAVADTTEEAAKLEAIMADESRPPEPDAMAAASADDPAAAFASDGKPLTPAQADKYVNLRAAPDNESEVLEIIPADTELLAEENCTHWCAVSHDGLQGYVYKTFIRR